MKNILEYNGYFAKIEFNAVDMVLYGKIEGIDDLITFESEDATKIEEEFHRALDDYIIFCEEVGKKPQKAYKGTFNIRISPQLHREIAIKALRNGETLNQTVENAIKEYLKPSSKAFSELCSAIISARTENVYKQSLEMWNRNKLNNYFHVKDEDKHFKYNSFSPTTTFVNRAKDEVVNSAKF